MCSAHVAKFPGISPMGGRQFRCPGSACRTIAHRSFRREIRRRCVKMREP
ncbi:hypothetical protein Agau_L101467 [Agrobacterium tumefaciens F2]|nr:hypothetical protein Agau_L101467 [Agrobacterium tumefaciens F2]